MGHAAVARTTIATSGFLTALECIKFVFGRSSALDPSGRAYSAPPDLLAALRVQYDNHSATEPRTRDHTE